MKKKYQTPASKPIKRRDFLSFVSGAALGGLAIPKATIARTVIDSAQTVVDSEITSYVIYPAIGVSRVGNSSQWFLAPEVPGIRQANGEYKDGNNKIKKQVQRYRIYGLNQFGEAVSEITLGNCRNIQWQMRAANSKAAWYGFTNPLDLGRTAPAISTEQRNKKISQQNREQMLIIDSGEVSLSARTESERELAGQFWGKKPVKLGTMRTDNDGRLLLFPADGNSASIQKNGTINNFTDNDYWHDDLFDGYVKATIELDDGRQIDAQPAWAISVGADFSPDTVPFTTLYDTIREVMIEKQFEPQLKPPLSFRSDIYPIFQRLGQMKWVVGAALQRKAWLDVGDFSDLDYIRKLADNSQHPNTTAFRKQVFELFRKPGDDKPAPYKMPYMLGGGVNYQDSPAHWYQIIDSQYQALQYWRDGLFINDFDDEELDQIQTIDDIPIAQQPDLLTRAALEACSGGAFHPGVELTWPMRHAAMYDGKYRIALGSRESLIQDLGDQITTEKAFKGYKNTPPAIGPQMPGDLTRWMGLPWQSDAFSCQSVRYANDFPVVAWWPAKIPIDVLTQNAYQQLQRTDLSHEEKVAFANHRESWSRGVAGIGYHVEASYTDGLNNMVQLWHQMGVLTKVTTAAPIPGIGAEFYVEMNRGSMELKDK